MNISRNFTLEELLRSATASRLGIENTPSVSVLGNLTQLCKRILQPLREAYGKSIIVTSGYRSLELNKAIGGAKNSQHMRGQAADIKGSQPSSGNICQENRRLFDLIRQLNLPFDQLIDEKNYSWIHVSFSDKPRKQVLHL